MKCYRCLAYTTLFDHIINEVCYYCCWTLNSRMNLYIVWIHVHERKGSLKKGNLCFIKKCFLIGSLLGWMLKLRIMPYPSRPSRERRQSYLASRHIILHLNLAMVHVNNYLKMQQVEQSSLSSSVKLMLFLGDGLMGKRFSGEFILNILNIFIDLI